jgi:hypothetical protein
VNADAWTFAEALAKELAAADDSRIKKSGKMTLYAFAFAGYALVSVALDEPARTAEALALVDALSERMSSEVLQRLYGSGRVKVAGRSLSTSIAPRGHLALLLAGRARLAPEPKSALLPALIDGLAEDVLRDRNHLMPTYGSRTWPADNEVVAAALSAFVKRHANAGRAGEALATLRSSLDALARSGLPPSAVAPDTLTAIDVPRGCALSWTVVMRGLHDPEAARALYRQYRSTYWFGLGGMAGFREWPPGTNRPADIDSGPIVLGVGAAATALGIGAARLSGETSDEAALLATAAFMQSQRAAALGWHERAILAFVHGARSWN